MPIFEDMDKKIFWIVSNSVGAMVGFCFRFSWENPIISVQLICLGLLMILYPKFCLRLFLSPVVVYTGFLLTALLSIGHRQQQEKDSALQRNKEGKALNEVCQLKRVAEESITEFSKYDQCAEENVISEDFQEEEFNAEFVNGMEIHGREVETEARSLNLSNEEIRVPDSHIDLNHSKSAHLRIQLKRFAEETITEFSSRKYDQYAEEGIISEDFPEEEFNARFVDGMEIHGRELETEVSSLNLSHEEIRVPDSHMDQNRSKSVHFSDDLIEGIYRTQLDVIMEENEEEEQSYIEISTPRKLDSDSDDEAPMNVSPQSEDREDQQQRKVRLEDFFSITLNCESTWRSFGSHGALASNNSCTSDDDDDDTGSSGSSEGSLGHLGPLLYIVDDSKHSHSTGTNLFVEDSSLPSNGGEELPVDFHFSWTEEDEREERESLFEIVHAGEEDNLIEIALSDQENSELPEIQATINQGNTAEQTLKAQEHREDKFEGPEEENLIEIDLSTHSVGLPEEIEEKNLIQGDLSDHSGDDAPVHRDPTPETESKLEEEIKTPEQNDSLPTEEPGKNLDQAIHKELK